MTTVRSLAQRAQPQLSAHDAVCDDVYAEHPFYEAQDVAAVLRPLLADPTFRATLELGELDAPGTDT